MEIKKLTLALVREDDKILLGLKKRGFGAGKWNGFGGKIEKNESTEEACKRELREEARINALNVEKRGFLSFEFQNDPVLLHVNVFHVKDFTGTPQETEEMKPRWFNIKDIPYSDMWADDKHWLPIFLNDQKFKAHFIFKDNSTIVQQKIEIVAF